MLGQLALRASDGATVTLERFPIILGRMTPGGVVPDVDVSHLDPQEAVDNRHCELFPDEGGVEVHDLGGVSGTWVDGRRLPPGGRAFLGVGGALRVAGVQLTLTPSPGRRPPSSPPPGSGPAAEEWRESSGTHGVPLPPSASSVGTAAVPAPSPPSVLDLSGAPALARPHLEGGALAVRMVEGFPLQILRDGTFTSEPDPLSQGAMEDALRAARRVLGAAEDAAFGWGYVGDLQIDFLAAPIASRANVGVAVTPSTPLGPAIASTAADWVAAGGGLLIAGRRPEQVLRALSSSLHVVGLRPWALSRSGSSWLPSGWGELRPDSEGVLGAALQGDPLVLLDPDDGELAAVLESLPRLSGGTVIALDSASPEAALERCHRLLPESPAGAGLVPERHPEEVARRLPRILTWQPAKRVRLCVPQVQSHLGGWGLEDLEVP